MITIQRFRSNNVIDPAQSNLIRQHPAEAAAWIWLPRWKSGQTTLVEFSKTIELNDSRPLKFHISADQRFQLRINGELVARGPDRSDVHHWAVASYRARLPRGKVRFSVLAWWLAEDKAPLAQMTFRPGFLFAAEGEFHSQLSTGFAEWEARDLSSAVDCHPSTLDTYHVIGPSFRFNLEKWNRPTVLKEPKALTRPVDRDYWGVRPKGWRLYPSPLPEQRNDLQQSGCIRAVRSPASQSAFHEKENPPSEGGWAKKFDALIKGEKAIHLPENSSFEILWDLDEYQCGYPHLEVDRGKGSSIRFEWAESLFQAPSAEAVNGNTAKGNRDEIEGKSYVGFGDEWTLDGSRTELPTLWWRSGRYLRLVIRTGKDRLTLRRIAIRTTGYPFRYSGKFESDHKGLGKIWPIFVGGMEHCAHEQWVDCPYYEQLSYVGDTNIELSAFCLTKDEKLSPRCLQLFDWSRHDSGLVAERYPSSFRQDSFTYALLYPRLVKNYAFWRDDPDFIQERMPGLRSLIETCLARLHSDGLLHVVPGWPFIDWVQNWEGKTRAGCPPSAWDGDSSLVNLHLYFALLDYAATEEGCGEPVLARRARQKARDLGRRILARYWDAEQSMLADDSAKTEFSEHAQAWIILSGILSKRDERRCLAAWERERARIAPMSIYFAHYAFEAYYRLKAEAPFFERLRFWEGLADQGLRTTPERPEPSRSDCHGWGAHPIYHSFASIAGIRPSTAGFRSVVIAPMPGPLKSINVRLPHPLGEIRLRWKRTGKTESATITLPKGLSGAYQRKDYSQPLESGRQKIEIPSSRFTAG